MPESSPNLMIADIVESSQTYNTEAGITGVLIHQNSNVLQAIEGEEETLRNLFQSIKDDSRHSKIVCHADQPIEVRSFENWAMEAFLLDTPKLFDSASISIIQQLFDRTFEMNPRAMIEFIKTIIDEADTFKISLDHKL